VGVRYHPGHFIGPLAFEVIIRRLPHIAVDLQTGYWSVENGCMGWGRASGCQAMRKLRKLTSPSMKMPRCTVSSGTGTLCLFKGNCGPQIGAHHRLGLLLKTSDAELYCACRTRDYVTWSVGTTGRSASSHYRRCEICRIQLEQGWYPIRGTARRRGGSGLG
jgi:hypothetical protein